MNTHRLVITIISLFFLCCTAGCSGTGNDTETDSPQAKANYSNDRKIENIDDIFPEFIKDNNEFSFDLYSTLASSTNNTENIFISPYSLSCAFAMTWAGARENTEREIADVLHFSFAQDTMHFLFSKLNGHLNSKGGDAPDAFTLHVTNDLWGQDGFHFEDDFIRLLSVNYGAGLTTLDFISKPEQSRLTINDWVEVQTEGLIEDLLSQGSITSDTRLVLTNTIYFKADWLKPFSDTATQPDTFTLLDETAVQVDMMSQYDYFSYASLSNCQAVELMYKDEKTSMIFLLPNEDGFVDVENNLDLNFFEQVSDALSEREVVLTLPKFSYGYQPKNLQDEFKKMGINDAFSFRTSDFSGITGDKSLAIDAISQKAFVTVDEKGTEAAAASVVSIGITGVSKTVDLNFNRPFFYFIVDKETTAILFMGKVVNPQCHKVNDKVYNSCNVPAC